MEIQATALSADQKDAIAEAGHAAVKECARFVVTAASAATSGTITAADAVSFSLVLAGDGTGQVEVSLLRDGTMERLLACDVSITAPAGSNAH